MAGVVGAETPPRNACATLQAGRGTRHASKGLGKSCAGGSGGGGGSFPADFSRALRSGPLDLRPQRAGDELPRAAQGFLAAIKAQFFSDLSRQAPRCLVSEQKELC